MESAIAREFETVDLLLGSDAQTRAVDAFAISWVKLERQLRRLNANLIFQHSRFEDKNCGHKDDIRQAILAKRTANHDKFINAIRKLSGFTVKDLIGEQYRPLKRSITTAYGHRQKILHGLQTGQSLGRTDLEMSIESIKNWCELLAEGSAKRIGYDGFSRNSLRKNGVRDIIEAVDVAVGKDWQEFVRNI